MIRPVIALAAAAAAPRRRARHRARRHARRGGARAARRRRPVRRDRRAPRPGRPAPVRHGVPAGGPCRTSGARRRVADWLTRDALRLPVARRPGPRHRRRHRGGQATASSSCCPPTRSTASAPTPSPRTRSRRCWTPRAGTRQMPPPVLIGSRHTLDGLVFSLPLAARDLVEAFWPGALTHRGGALAEPAVGPGRHSRHGGGADAAAPGGAGGAAGDRPDGGVLGQQDRPAGRGHRRGGPRPARLRGARLPGGRAVPGPGAEHHRRPDRRGAAGAAPGRHPAGEAARRGAGHRRRQGA